jgi:hypothetical protein
MLLAFGALGGLSMPRIIPQYLFLLAVVAPFSMCLCSKSFGQPSDGQSFDELFVKETAFCLVDPLLNISKKECPSHNRFQDGGTVKISDLTSSKIYFWGLIKRPVKQKQNVKSIFARRGECYEQGEELRKIEQELQESVSLLRCYKSGECKEKAREILDSGPARLVEFASEMIIKRPATKIFFLGGIKLLDVVLDPAVGTTEDVDVSDSRDVSCEGGIRCAVFRQG